MLYRHLVYSKNRNSVKHDLQASDGIETSDDLSTLLVVIHLH